MAVSPILPFVTSLRTFPSPQAKGIPNSTSRFVNKLLHYWTVQLLPGSEAWIPFCCKLLVGSCIKLTVGVTTTVGLVLIMWFNSCVPVRPNCKSNNCDCIVPFLVIRCSNWKRMLLLDPVGWIIAVFPPSVVAWITFICHCFSCRILKYHRRGFLNACAYWKISNKIMRLNLRCAKISVRFLSALENPQETMRLNLRCTIISVWNWPHPRIWVGKGYQDLWSLCAHGVMIEKALYKWRPERRQYHGQAWLMPAILEAECSIVVIGPLAEHLPYHNSPNQLLHAQHEHLM